MRGRVVCGLNCVSAIISSSAFHGGRSQFPASDSVFFMERGHACCRYCAQIEERIWWMSHAEDRRVQVAATIRGRKRKFGG